MDDYKAFTVFLHEEERLDMLEILTHMIASDNFADDAISEEIQEYRDAYGALPDKFLRLLEDLDGRQVPTRSDTAGVNPYGPVGDRDA